MTKGELLKANATAWSKSQSSKMSASAITDGTVQHANASTWFDNYPMEELFTQTFNATWSQGWLGSGTRLDDGVWQGNVITGSTNNYRGMFGFNKSAIQSFLASGIDFGGVQSARLHINCYETTVNGSPDVRIGKHSYTSEPAGTWTGQNADWGDQSTLHVPNQALGGYWIDLNPTQITLADKRTAIGGIALMGASATNEDMGKFNGVNSFTSQLEITVLK
jgi:hypothetical protein